MKTRVHIPTILVLLVFVQGLSSAQGWFIQHSFVPAQTLQTIKFYDNAVGYSVSSLFNGSTLNIYKTTNGGNTWTAQNSGYTSMRFMSIFIFHPDTVLISGNDGIIVKTTNGGASWITMPTGVTNQLWSLEFTSRTTGYCAGSAGTILKTTDSGNSWFSLNSGVQNQLYCLKFLNDNAGYVSGSGIVLRTTNRGESWEDIHFPPIPPFDELRQLVFTDPATAYVIADIGRMRKTTDAGNTWTMLNTGTTEALFGIDFVDQSTAYACGYNGAIIKTTNAGQTWALQTSGLSEILYGIDFTSRDTGYICTWSGKILKTTNGGATFVPPSAGEMPIAFELFQNYPNPFNPSTVIQYSLPKEDCAILSIYDAAGRDLVTLVDGHQHPGTHLVLWEPHDFASGLYFARLQAGGTTMTRKMLIVK